MTYKEFDKWCNERCFDGCWGMKEAIICIDIIEKMKETSFFQRRGKWRELEPAANEIVTLTNKKIKEVMENSKNVSKNNK